MAKRDVFNELLVGFRESEAFEKGRKTLRTHRVASKAAQAGEIFPNTIGWISENKINRFICNFLSESGHCVTPSEWYAHPSQTYG